jgi:hypothetical protein
MSSEVKVISATGLPATGQPQVVQTGNDNVTIPNYGTVNLTVQQQFATMPAFGGSFYVPVRVNREYYNIFVIGGEEFDKPYFKVPRDRALTHLMSKETMDRFAEMTQENKEEIKTMPSLFMAENRNYGKADDDQMVIYGFVSDLKIYDNDVKVYYCGYKIDIPQQRLNECLEELGLVGDNRFNELNRTHWSIKRCDLIQELLEAGVQIPVFNMG